MTDLDIGVRVRRATPDDVDAISDVRIRTWQVAYRGIVPDPVLDRLQPDKARLENHRRELANEVETATFVATTGTDVVGFSRAGRCRDVDQAPTTGELWAVYLLPELWGHGHGGQLMAACDEFLLGGGYGDAVLWMFESNARAQAFYERHGWALDGGRRDLDVGAFIPEVRFRKRLGA